MYNYHREGERAAALTKFENLFALTYNKISGLQKKTKQKQKPSMRYVWQVRDVATRQIDEHYQDLASRLLAAIMMMMEKGDRLDT
jgi:hypothetical protein